MSQVKSILLVDDDEVTNFVHQSVIEETLSPDNIIVAKNGQQALDLIQAAWQETHSCPDLTFLDINMPVMNGFEFLEAYQQLDQDLRRAVVVAMLTSSSNLKDVERAENSSVADFLNKPLTPEALAALLNKHF